MQRIVFINLHANEFLVKTLNKYIWKQSCAFKHKYLLDYLLHNPEIEVCNYINEDGFTLVRSFPKPIMWFLKKLRFLENRIVMRKNGIARQAITVIKSREDIRPDDIVIGYVHTESSLADMDKISAFKAVSMIHFYGYKDESELVKKANPDVLFNESNLYKTSKLFRRNYAWYNKDVIVQFFVAAPRFKKIKSFAERENRCFSTGTITYREQSEFIDTYGSSCLQPIRKLILINAETLDSYCSCYNSDYLEDTDMKKYASSDSFFQHYYKVWYNMKHAGQQKKYFSFNMVDKFNDFKMCLIGEEVIGVPGIGFVEGMSCGCAYIGDSTTGYYEAYGMQAGIHYIGYDGTLEDLKAKIAYYQQPENLDKLECIANEGYKFARGYFNNEYAAKDLLNKLLAAQQVWRLSK